MLMDVQPDESESFADILNLVVKNVSDFDACLMLLNIKENKNIIFTAAVRNNLWISFLI